MKKLNKVAMMFAVAALATAAGAQTRVTAADGGPTIDNWQNGTGELVWKNGTRCQLDARNGCRWLRRCSGSCRSGRCGSDACRSGSPDASASRRFEGDLRC